VRFEVVRAVNIKIEVFWIVRPCRRPLDLDLKSIPVTEVTFYKLSCPYALIEHHVMKACWGSGGIASAKMEVSGQLHAPASLFPERERAPGNHWIQGWVGPRQLERPERRGKDNVKVNIKQVGFENVS
jgi:hypothetical protein